jgi:hypothetical protein
MGTTLTSGFEKKSAGPLRRDDMRTSHSATFLAGFLICFIPAAVCLASTIHVPGDAATIQAGIDLAVSGDVVEVACGVYTEHGIMMKSGITLRSATGSPECTRIAAGGLGPVIICDTVSGCIIEGFNLTNGRAEQGGGIICIDASPLIRFCIIRNNDAISAGGGVACLGHSTPTFRHCTFVYNRTASSGSAILAAGSSTVQLETSIVTYGGGGMQFTGAVFCQDGGSAHCTSCDIWGNNDGDWVGSIHEQSRLSGNFFADPCFCGEASNDFTLSNGSWCLNVNHPWGWNVTVGALGAGCDIGTCGLVPVESQTWGALKQLYR